MWGYTHVLCVSVFYAFKVDKGRSLRCECAEILVQIERSKHRKLASGAEGNVIRKIKFSDH